MAISRTPAADFFAAHGYYVARGLFGRDEAEALREHYMRLRAAGTYEGDMVGADIGSDDPLKRFPRMIHMHRWDQRSRQFLVDGRMRDQLTTLLGREPYAVATMLYFKPPGARGQAFHQDNFYLKVRPGTCVGAWLALDPADEDNGCLRVIPGSHTWPLLCTQKADTTQSFTDVTVPLPEGTQSVPVVMEPGDVMFFHGSLVHGSTPNVTKDRFRRCLIGHYVEGTTTQYAKYNQPALRFDGSTLEMPDGEEGGPCGVWVDVEGKRVIELSGVQGRAADLE